MKQIFLLPLLLLSSLLYSQNEFYNPYVEFSDSSEVYLLNEKVAVYENPDFKSAIIARLNSGTKVNLIKKLEIIAVKKGLFAAFCEVSFHSGKSLKKGFIWSGDFAFKAENHSKDQNLIFLFGISKIEKNIEKNKEDEHYLICKILAKNKLLAKKEFKALGNLSFYRYLNVYDNKGVKGIKNILNFELRNYYNAGDYGQQVLFWDGKNISAVRDIKNTDDPPCYYTENLIYPSDNDGLKDIILIKSENGCNEGDQQIDVKIGQFIWKNNSLLHLETKSIID